MAIERKFVSQKLKEFMIKEFIADNLNRVGLSDIKLQRTPLGDKIIIRAMRPGLVVGRGGSNIQRLTDELKNQFNLENPQIEIEEVEKFALDANIIAELIVNSLERYGSAKFKGVGHRALSDVMNAGALGVEILISGKIPSSRAKTWRFYQGYLKKCGDLAVSGVDISYLTATLKTGVVGVKVSILPPTVKLPDAIDLHVATIEEVTDEPVAKEVEKAVEKETKKTDVKETTEKAPVKTTKATKKTTKKTTEKKTAKKTTKKTAAKAEKKTE